VYVILVLVGERLSIYVHYPESYLLLGRQAGRSIEYQREQNSTGETSMMPLGQKMEAVIDVY